MLGVLRRWLGAEDRAVNEPAEVDPLFSGLAGAEALGELRLGGRVRIDLLAQRAYHDRLVFRWEAAPHYHAIAAIGHIDLGGDAHLCRFYLDNDTFLQLSLEGGALAEIKLFDFFAVTHLADREFDRLINAPGAGSQAHALGAERHALRADTGTAFEFTRVWGEPGQAWTPPVMLHEKVVSRERPGRRPVTHYGMLYERSVTDAPLMEYLFLSAEDDHDGGFMLVENLGIDLSWVDIDAIRA
ncbi:DUF2491 family protein [Halomonas salifodinae]|uniref:DUF2491 family protein n=1 Tax=Halomonas salifodinae TaxID=438745 RepID=UPI0033AE036C